MLNLITFMMAIITITVTMPGSIRMNRVARGSIYPGITIPGRLGTGMRHHRSRGMRIVARGRRVTMKAGGKRTIYFDFASRVSNSVLIAS